MTTTVLIDTNLLLLARSYHIAKIQSNDKHLALLSTNAKEVYQAIESRGNDGNPFYVSDMSVVEMKVVHIRNSFHEFARDVYQMPIGSLQESRGNIKGEIRQAFNETQLPSAAQEFDDLLKSWGVMQKLKILPDVLPDSERMAWRKRQEIIFRTVGNYVSLDTQDAYIFASAMAMGIDQIWTGDNPFRTAADQLKKSNYVDLIKNLDGVLFLALSLPVVQRLNKQSGIKGSP